MSLDVTEFAQTYADRSIPMLPEIGYASLATGGTTTYTAKGPGGTIVELYANGAAHTYSVSGGAGATRSLASGERVTYGITKDLVITVLS